MAKCRGNRQSFGVRGNRQVEQKNNNSGFGSRRDNNSFGSGSRRDNNGIRRNSNGVASGSSRDINSFGSSRGNSGFGSRESSTRTTVNQSVRHNLIDYKPRELKVEGKSPRSTFTPSQQRPAQPSQSTGSNRGSFGGGSRSVQSTPSRGNGGSSKGGGGSFGSRR